MAIRLNIKKILLRVIGWPNYLRRLQWFSIHRMLNLQGYETVLDLGAGPMQYAIKLAQIKGIRVIAADIELHEDRIIEAKKYGVEPLKVNGQSLPMPDHKIDCILMSSLLHMVPKPEKLLEECHRVLNPDGCIVLSVPNQYQFIPKIMESLVGGRLCRLLGLPRTYGDLISHLNSRFYVGGPQGYYSYEELTALLESSGFKVVEHEYAPGRFGSMLWELAVLGYVRFGNIVFHLLFLMYPIARLAEAFTKKTVGSEHIVKVLPVYEH